MYMTDWGLEKDFLHSSRKNMWNNDYFEFLVKCVWKIDKPVRIIKRAFFEKEKNLIR